MEGKGKWIFRALRFDMPCVRISCDLCHSIRHVPAPFKRKKVWCPSCAKQRWFTAQGDAGNPGREPVTVKR